jgi:hypothetical protein
MPGMAASKAEFQVGSEAGPAVGFLTRWARYDLPRIFSRMAPSTIRSKKAMASGGSPRYSLQASKSMLVARAVERFPLRASMTF